MCRSYTNFCEPNADQKQKIKHSRPNDKYPQYRTPGIGGELIRLNYALLYQLNLNEWVWRKEAYERYPGDCDGQSGYGVSKLDSIVEEVVRQIFAQFREVSRKKLLESVKTNDAARI